MKSSEQTTLQKVLREVEARGLLLQTDPDFPSVVTMIVGEPVKGSWWGHPSGNLIFNVCCALDDHPDILTMKLLKGKVTFVHRKLWIPLLAVVTSRAEWQISGLDKAGHALLEAIDRKGEVRVDAIKARDLKQTSKNAAELESHLLILTQQIHTESGAHAKVLLSWKEWMRKRPLRNVPMSASEGMKTLENTVNAISTQSKIRRLFAWQ